MVSRKLVAAGQPNTYQSPGLPWWLSGKEFTCKAGDAGDVGSIPGSGRSPEEGNGYHFSILAWEILWTEESGGLQSVRSQRIGHNLAAKQQPTWCGLLLKRNL